MVSLRTSASLEDAEIDADIDKAVGEERFAEDNVGPVGENTPVELHATGPEVVPSSSVSSTQSVTQSVTQALSIPLSVQTFLPALNNIRGHLLWRSIKS